MEEDKMQTQEDREKFKAAHGGSLQHKYGPVKWGPWRGSGTGKKRDGEQTCTKCGFVAALTECPNLLADVFSL